MRRGRVTFGQRAAHLAQFTHQICLGMQPSCRVTNHEFDIPTVRGAICIVTNRGGIAVVLALDNIAPDTLRPYFELLDGRGAEGIGRGEQTL